MGGWQRNNTGKVTGAGVKGAGLYLPALLHFNHTF